MYLRPKFQSLFILILMYCSVFFALIGTIRYLTIAILLFSLSIVTWCVNKIEKHLLLLLFVLSFNLFVMGTYYCNIFSPYGWWENIKGTMMNYSIQEHSIIYALILVYISLISIVISYIYFLKKRNISRIEYVNFRVSMPTYFVNLMRRCYLFFSIGSIINIMLKISVVFTHSYVFLYNGFQENIILKWISLVSEVFFWCYLATFPSKKQLKLPIFVFILISILNLFTGSRGNTMLNIFFIIFYCGLRDNTKTNLYEKWLPKHIKLYSLLSIPIVCVVLASISFLRNKQSISTSFINLIFDFLGNQGESGLLIPLSMENTTAIIAENINFTFGNILRGLQSNNFWSDFFGLRYIGGLSSNSVEYAHYANSFSAAITNYYMTYNFRNGLGLGGSYLAELWLDYGLFGIVVFNLFLGWFISRCATIKLNNFYINALLFCVVQSLLDIGRTSCFKFLQNFTSSIVLLSYIIIFLSFYLINKRTTRER